LIRLEHTIMPIKFNKKYSYLIPRPTVFRHLPSDLGLPLWCHVLGALLAALGS
jgi:hypothetical protein